MRNTKKGFTLVELLVVIAILAVLATVSVVGYTSFIDRANQSTALQEMTQIRDSVIAEDILNPNFSISGGVLTATEVDDSYDTFDVFVTKLLADLGEGREYALGAENKSLVLENTDKKVQATWTFSNNEITTDKLVECKHKNTETLAARTATCTETGLSEGVQCSDCGEILTAQTVTSPATGHDWENGTCKNGCGATAETGATMEFVGENRSDWNENQQIWAANGIVVTNDKGGSTNNVADYVDPARFYKNSTVTVAYPGMRQIIFNCNTAAYATSLAASIGGTATVSDKVVTVVLNDAVNSYTVTLSDGQVRVDSITVSTSEPTQEPEGGNQGGSGESPDETLEEVVNCDFSTVSGTQYANESKSFGDYITVSTHNEGCHFNTQLRIYDSASNNGYAVISSTNVISSLVINAGYKAATLEVYGSVDGENWVSINNVTTKTSYADYTVDVDETLGYKYIKLDASGAQIRIASIDVTIVK